MILFVIEFNSGDSDLYLAEEMPTWDDAVKGSKLYNTDHDDDARVVGVYEATFNTSLGCWSAAYLWEENK